MPTIRILPDVLANKIAAGEVVERPASVVKELVENALDAGATRIFVEVENGGKTLIRVSDNGCGMSRDDALLCIERHATSKIFRDEDLFSIRTLGFRGEALPSISSVSRFILVTREETSDFGVELILEGGRLNSVKETGAPVGTMVSVTRLFFNTPARRKFMKTPATELGHITDILSTIALCRPDIYLRLDSNGKTIQQFTPVADRKDRVVDLWGASMGKNLHSVDHQAGDMGLQGWVAAPDAARNTSRYQQVFVNGRVVRDRIVSHALSKAFSGHLMKGRFPMAALWIEIPPERVDVNVHPTKNEVRFADPGAVHGMVVEAVTQALSRPRSFDHAKGDSPRFSGDVPMDFPIRDREMEQTVCGSPVGEKTFDYPKPPQQAPLYLSEFLPEAENHLRVIGQFGDAYILCEGGRELVLIDQHAAHERILYERLKQRRFSDSQYLLIPETVECSAREARLLESIIPDLGTVGLMIEPFGPDSFVVKAVPALLPACDAGRLIRELIDRLEENEYSVPGVDRLDDCLKLMACHGAIRAGQTLSFHQMKALVEDIHACTSGARCPHGRPTRIELSMQEVEKRFGRTG